MEHVLIGGQYDGEVVDIQYGDELSLPKRIPCPTMLPDNADVMSTPIDYERYIRRDFYRGVKRVQVFAHSLMTDDQVMKTIGL